MHGNNVKKEMSRYSYPFASQLWLLAKLAGNQIPKRRVRSFRIRVLNQQRDCSFRGIKLKTSNPNASRFPIYKFKAKPFFEVLFQLFENSFHLKIRCSKGQALQ